MTFFSDSEIYEKSYAEALEANKNTINQINDFKRELEAVRANLKENRKHLYVNVVTPFSSKAMIRGKLVHTNEVYVNLGDRWFVKASCEKALEISERMIERCNENTSQWEKETNLLCSNLKMLEEVSAFPTETLKDIVEPYDEAYETCWREQHKERVREHKKRELNNRLTDEELLQHLDQLEIEEAATRTNVKAVDLIEKRFDLVRASSKNNAEPLRKKKTDEISSPDENTLVSQRTREDVPGVSVIQFKHSDKILKSLKRTENETIVSPNDVYERFLHPLSPKPNITKSSKPHHTTTSAKKGTGHMIGDIVEKQFSE